MVAGEGGRMVGTGETAEGERGGDAESIERGEETERGEGRDAGSVIG